MTATHWQRSADLQTERALLGGLIRAPHKLGEVSGLLGVWRAPEHEALYRLLIDMREEGAAIDSVTVPLRIGQSARPDDCGGVAYASGLTSHAPAVANLTHYAAELRRMAAQRAALALVEAAPEAIVSEGLEGIDRLARALHATLDGAVSEAVPSVADEAGPALDQLLSADGNRILPTGLRDLDEFLGGGLEVQTLTIIAGRPAMGKSSVAETIEQVVAMGGGVVHASVLEGGKPLRWRRCYSRTSGVPQWRIKERRLDDRDHVQLQRARETLERAAKRWHWVCRGSQRVEDVERYALQARRKHGRLDLIVVDYAQLMPLDHRLSTADGLKLVSDRLAALAIELDCAVVLLSQLNRGVEDRNDKRPMLSDLKSSGGLEEAAALVLGLYRDEYYRPEGEERGVVEVIVLKNRSGRNGKVRLRWEGEYTRVSDLPDERPSPPADTYDYDRGGY